MSDLARRFDGNPLLRPADVTASRPDFVVEGLLNPGAFSWKGRVGLLVRVAERPLQEEGFVTVPVMDGDETRVLRFSRSDPKLVEQDPRVFWYGETMYLTTLSHLRLAWSEDGVRFEVEPRPAVQGHGPLEAFGVEDCRVTEIEGVFHLTYTAVSSNGVAVGLITTSDWSRFIRHGVILPPHNKDCALLPRPVDGAWWALHRPSGVDIGGNFIWIARSPDRLHWGAHECLLRTRPGQWDGERVGAGASPIETGQGWLEIYHGADANMRYCLGAILLDRDDPRRVLKRSRDPIMEPLARYEQSGFFGNVVFTNGHRVDGDELTLYYGASDELVCGATLSIAEILASLR
jgi:predicted GH43/DUF377 family glycosyl hydrolase